MVEETRAGANLEVVEEQRREEQEWGRFGRLRRRWDKRFEDPNDVLTMAKRRRQELKQAALKKRKHAKSKPAPAKPALRVH